MARKTPRKAASGKGSPARGRKRPSRPSNALPRPSWRRVADLRPSRNARLHPAEQVERIARSIDEFGFLNPALVDERGFILAGHGRWQAAKLRSLDEIPVLEVAHLSAAQKRAYILADNRLAELSGWDSEILASELSALRDVEGWDLSLIGFDPDSVRDALADAARRTRAATSPDAAPAAPDVVVSRPGDVWLCGPHRVTCGDATKPEDVARVLDGATPELCVTDPPYGIEYDPVWRAKLSRTGKRPPRDRAVANDDRADWREAWALFPGSVVYAWTGGAGALIIAGQALEASGFPLRAQIIWRKPHFPLSRGAYTFQHESCWYGMREDHEACWYGVRKGGKAGWTGPSSASTIWEASLDETVSRHSTQKPVELFRLALEHHRGDLYEPFLGSGTGLIAAEMTGRTCYGLELDPSFVDVVVRRWQDFTEATARLEGDGSSFSEVAQERGNAAAKTKGRRRKRARSKA